MAKRTIAVAFLALCLLVCSSCADSGPRHKSYEDENGNFVIESDGRKTVSVSELPASVPYNDKSISLTSVAFYQNCTNYSYSLFTVITLDVSALDDSEIHWLRNSDLDVDSYITCEANEYDFDSSYPLGNVLFTDSKELVFVEMSSLFKENRYGFEDSKVRVSVLVTQEDTYTSSSNSSVEINKKEGRDFLKVGHACFVSFCSASLFGRRPRFRKFLWYTVWPRSALYAGRKFSSSTTPPPTSVSWPRFSSVYTVHWLISSSAAILTGEALRRHINSIFLRSSSVKVLT